eukprot:TRINITY_DN7243_c0_g1_i17.p2 TRINITY_DN7243_c0_g1~~TRINITY_DN7243_c0_g1_i17.p2  ORF type:complete len:175 (-),score=42.96 TRINITY_DN7243_c0_g1_i17:428-952(-)
MRGVNDMELVDFVSWTKEKPIQVRFIEYMPFSGNTWKDNTFVPYTEMLERIREKFPVEKKSEISNNETSKTYFVPGFVGSIGFITSMSQHFCGSCNRIRLMADGAFKVCLFGPNEVSLRDIMRSGGTDAELLEWISMAVHRKKFSHAGMFEIDREKDLNRPMVLIDRWKKTDLM